MNERIKELARQAGFVVLRGQGYEDVFVSNETKKFAELIVRECAAYFRDAEGTAHGLEEHFGINDE